MNMVQIVEIASLAGVWEFSMKKTIDRQGSRDTRFCVSTQEEQIVHVE
ncbi:MAG: hypothetical protein AAB296_00700 [Candidatus Desantisbacteria bacterium]